MVRWRAKGIKKRKSDRSYPGGYAMAIFLKRAWEGHRMLESEKRLKGLKRKGGGGGKRVGRVGLLVGTGPVSSSEKWGGQCRTGRSLTNQGSGGKAHLERKLFRIGVAQPRR